MIDWQMIACTAQGGMHKDKGMPCQDHAAVSGQTWGRILTVADGHGNKRHFRSEIGARFACDAAQAVLDEFSYLFMGESCPTSMQLELLKLHIIERWRDLVREDIKVAPWTEDEDKNTFDDIKGEAWKIPYGTTLIISVITKRYWIAMQIGDGMFVVADDEGHFFWPMPESKLSIGNKTASICMDDPLPEFRHCMGAMDDTAGVLLCSDGIEKAFPKQGEVVCRYIHRLFTFAQNEPDEAQELLQGAAESTACHSVVRDDVGIALLVRCGFELKAPLPTDYQKEQKRQQLMAKADETETVIRYTLAQYSKESDADRRGELLRTLERQLEAAEKLYVQLPTGKQQNYKIFITPLPELMYSLGRERVAEKRESDSCESEVTLKTDIKTGNIADSADIVYATEIFLPGFEIFGKWKDIIKNKIEGDN